MRFRLYYIILLFFFIVTNKVHSQVQFSGSVDVESNDIGMYDFRKNIVIFTFPIESDATEALEFAKRNGGSLNQARRNKTAEVRPNEMGSFMIEMDDTPTSVMLVWCNDYVEYQARIIKRRNLVPGMTITLKKSNYAASASGESLSDVHRLSEIEVKAKSEVKKGTFTRSSVEDGVMTSESYLTIPFDVTSNLRVIVQPLWFDRKDVANEDKDSLFAYGHMVYKDNDEYNMTQERRMSFDLKYDMLYNVYRSDERNIAAVDSLNLHRIKSDIGINATHDTINIHLLDTLSGYDPSPSHPYPFGAIVKIVDYNTELYSNVIKDNGERYEPLKFLDFSFNEFLPNRNDFFEKMQDTRMDIPGELRLNFMLNKAVLVSNDTANIAQLRQLQKTFQEIRDDEDRGLNKITVYGMSSPEGSYEKNYKLAKERSEYTAKQIKAFTDRPIYVEEPVVAPWTWVADTMKSSGLTAEAEAMYKIIKEYPDNLEKQGRQISRLPYYSSVIKNYLPIFRAVRYTYIENRLGQKPTEIILREYRNNPMYSFTRGEYWELFDFITDKKELEGVAKHALATTRDSVNIHRKEYSNGYWPYAAALLACCYIARDTADMDILLPFLDYELINDSIKSRVLRRDEESKRIIGYINFPEMAANQLIMTLKQTNRKYRKVIPYLESIIKAGVPNIDGTPYDTLFAFSKCLRGGYKAGSISDDVEAQKIRNIVSSTSKVNAVILNLALDNPEDKSDDANYLYSAVSDTINLPDNAVGNYLRAIMFFRLDKKNKAEKALMRSFVQNIDMIGVANNDKDFVGTYSVLPEALALWHNYMDSVIIIKQKNYDNIISDSLQTDSLLLDKPLVEEKNIENETHPYTWFKRGMSYISANDDNSYSNAKDAFLKCFALDDRYMSVLNVHLMRDKEIKNNKKLRQSLLNVRREYYKKSRL